MNKFRIAVLSILVIQFGLHLLLYYNTETFSGISESGALFGTLDQILNGGRPKPLYGFYWYFTPAYIAFFLIQLFGSIDSYFIFQCFLATVTSFLVWKLVFKISGSELSGLVAVVLTTVYTEFLLLSSVFYNQVYENFFLVLFLLILVNFIRKGSAIKVVLNGAGLILVTLGSLLFRNTMLFIFFYLLLAGLFFLWARDSQTGKKLLVMSAIIFGLVFIVRPFDRLREGAHKPGMLLEFWGHTPYGGNGGEVGFIYPENEELFNKRLSEYADRNNEAEITLQVLEDFKAYEVKRFITREPHKWILLQVKKILYTFGVMPQRDGLTMLVNGKADIGWVTAAVMLQFPFLIIMILFILTADFSLQRMSEPPGYRFLVFLMGAYLITGISVFATWAERYRIVAMLAFIIPVIAVDISRLRELVKPENRKSLLARSSFAILMIVVWGLQAYEALILHPERYVGALDKMIQ